ncbi:MAG: RNA polymerase sigma factor [Candidatus Latescibacterota bacterium]|nr:MAG: RNA polymerase sigma factor [Candidatus Latescibacterota bacterium]
MDCARGHRQSFEPLVERYYKVLFNVALRLVHDYDEALDVTQTTFMKAFEKIDTFDPKHKFFSWIYRILLNESLNQLSRRKPKEPLDPGLVAGGDSPEEAYDLQRLSDRVQAGLTHLSLEHRQVLVLRHFADLSYKEIGSILSIPEKTVKSRLFSARRQLCAVLSRGRATT